MKRNIFISIHRFDDDLISFINGRYDNAENSFAPLFELKNKGVKILIRTLIGYRNYDQVVIVFNDEHYLLVEHLFYCLSCFIIKPKIEKILPDYGIKKVSLWTRFFAILKMIFSAMETRQILRRVDKDITANIPLKKYPRLTSNSHITYLKTNLSFGTKAGGSLGHISGVVNALAKKTNLLYVAADLPVMIDDNVQKSHILVDGIVYSMPYELNGLKINRRFIEETEKIIHTSGKPNCIYQRLTLYNYSGAYLAGKYGVPLIIEYNGSEAWIQANWGSRLKYSELALKIEEFVLRSADTIITVSQVLKDELVERGFYREKIVFYPNCIDPRMYDQALYDNQTKNGIREQLGFTKDDLVFTFIGTFGMWHGVDFLADTIIDLAVNHRDELKKNSIQFLLIGDGLLGNEVRKKLAPNEIAEFVKLTGIVPQHEAPKYLSISDCFLSPHAKQEGKFIGSPTKLFEYMAFARPIIASNLDQVGEVFDHKLYADHLNKSVPVSDESAIVFSPGSQDEFKRAILFVAKNYESTNNLGQNAYDMVMAKYTWDKHVDQIIGKFNEKSM